MHEALARHGIGSAGADYAMTVLAAAVYARGWSYDIDRIGSDYRATIHQSGEGQKQFHVAGMGWSLEAALAFALEKALSIARRRESLAAV